MQVPTDTDGHTNELDVSISKEQIEDPAGVLEILPSLAATRTTATGVEVHILEGTHTRSHVNTRDSVDPTVIGRYEVPPAQTPGKKSNVYLVSAFCSLGGFVFGADIGSIGSIVSMPQFVDLCPALKNEAVLGALVATAVMSASVSSFASGRLSDKYSRKWTIVLGAYIFAIGAALEAGSINLPMLLIGRLSVGLGEGFFFSTIAVYLVEIAPPDVRGRISCMLQLFATIGIAVGYFVCYSTLGIQSTFSWRIPFMVQASVAAILGVGMPFLPYSPRWLFQKGRVEEAWKVLEAFDRHSSSEKEKEELLAKAQEQQGQAESVGIPETFRHSKGRTLLAMFMMGMQQLSGIDAVLFYGPTLFSQAGLSSRQSSFLASGVSGILNVVCTIPAQLYLLDKWGRRSSAIIGGLLMAVCMLSIGSLYAAGAEDGRGRYAIIAFIYLFVILYSTTWAVSFKLFISEVQSMRVRATASSLGHTSGWLCNLATTLTTPLFLSRTPSGPYFLFGACLVLTSIVCTIWMPETLGKSLQEVDEVWETRMKRSKEIIHSMVTCDGRRGRRGSVGEFELQERERV